MRSPLLLRLPAVALATLVLFPGCSSDEGGGPVAPQPDPTLVAIEVTAASIEPLTALGATVQMSAGGQNSAGAAVAVTPSWSSSDEGVATVDGAGRVTARGDGTATIAATVGGVTGSAAVTVAQQAARLAFVSQQEAVVQEEAFDEPVVVQVLDANDNPVVNAGDPVSLDVASGGAGVLTGTLQRTPEAGVATFDDIRYDGAPGRITLRADLGALGAVGPPLEVIAAPPFDTFQAASVVLGQPSMTSNAVGDGATGGMDRPFSVGSDGQRLFVSEVGGSRLLAWNSIPTSDGAAPDFQMGYESLGVGFRPTQSPLSWLPEDVVIAEGKLFVVQHNAHRILIWNRIPSGPTPPDVVVGQPSFEDVTSGTTNVKFDRPRSVAIADGRMFVADQSNNRVLVFNRIPTADGAPADLVLGQPDFISSEPRSGASGMSGPRGVWVQDGRLFVSESLGGNNRVMIWNELPTRSDQPADLVLGQTSLEGPSSGLGNDQRFAAHAVTGEGDYLLAIDRTRARILLFRDPRENGAAALRVLGQSNFDGSARNDPDQDGVESGPSARTFSRVDDVLMIGGRLFVADFDNNRVLIFQGR